MNQSSDGESNCGSPIQTIPSRNAVNICICRASNDLFEKDNNLLIPDAQKHDQLVKENSAANDLGIFQEINK